MHGHLRQASEIGREVLPQYFQVRQPIRGEIVGQQTGELSFAGSFMRHTEQFDHQLARSALGQPFA